MVPLKLLLWLYFVSFVRFLAKPELLQTAATATCCEWLSNERLPIWKRTINGTIIFYPYSIWKNIFCSELSLYWVVISVADRKFFFNLFLSHYIYLCKRFIIFIPIPSPLPQTPSIFLRKKWSLKHELQKCSKVLFIGPFLW